MTKMVAMLIYGKNLQKSNRPRYQVSVYRTIGPLVSVNIEGFCGKFLTTSDERWNSIHTKNAPCLKDFLRHVRVMFLHDFSEEYSQRGMHESTLILRVPGEIVAS